MKIGDHFFYHTTSPDEWLVGKITGSTTPDFGTGYSYRIIVARISHYHGLGLDNKDYKIGRFQVDSRMWDHLVTNKRKIIKTVI